MKKYTIVIIGSCKVIYEGRASSTLDYGERIVILKQDGSTLIHRPTGYKPVNWQPSGASIKIKPDDTQLIIEIVRRVPKEIIQIYFKNISMISSNKMKDNSTLYMYATEKDMQKAIFLNPDIIENGLRNLVIEKVHPDGYIDIFANDENKNTVILELKRKKATKADVLQMYKYVELYRKTNSNIRGILVAPSLAKGSQLMLDSLNLEFKALSPEACSQLLRKNRIVN